MIKVNVLVRQNTITNEKIASARIVDLRTVSAQK